MNKKITLLISNLAGGGAEGVCVNVANGLAETGWQVNLVILNANNAVYLDRLSNKVNLVNLQVKRALHAFVPLRKYLIKESIGQVLVFNYSLVVISIILKKTIRQDIKIIARNINTLSQGLAAATGFWQKYIVYNSINALYRKVDHVINQCHAMENDLLKLYPSLKGKTSVIYNPVNKVIEDTLKRLDLNSIVKEDYILCVGRLEFQKAFHFAIEAFAAIA
ncbi:MAG TPA: glycosyltransferase, partial [Chitinophagaceae bacterium]|nr:glycosyltransferase [Chitinophagaceae bacterium]